MTPTEPTPLTAEKNDLGEPRVSTSGCNLHPLVDTRGSPRNLLHLLVLLAFLGVWTWKLLEPNPVPESLSAKLQGEVRFVAAKGLHACGYAFLTLLAVTLPVPNYWRWFFAGLLALHGVATEIGQTFVPGRVGSARDVLIDWTGILLGVLVWRAARRRPDEAA